MTDTELDIDIGDDPTVIETEDADGVSVSLWTKKGRRLYLNDFGPSSANRYIDLNAGTIEGGYTSGLEIDIDDTEGTLTVSGRGSTIVIDLGLGCDEGRSDDTEQPDGEESDAVSPQAEIEEMNVALAGDAAGRHGAPPNLPRESAIYGLEHNLDTASEDIPLEPGMVFWRTTSVVGDGDGYYALYLYSGRVTSLSGGGTISSSDSSIRDDIHTGILDPVDVEDLPPELRETRIEKMEQAAEKQAELAVEFREEGQVSESYIDQLQSESAALETAVAEARQR
jgi:hypothetical protein